MEHIERKIQADYPEFHFVGNTAACWSPRDKEIHYNLATRHGLASLLHELAHALLGHQTYRTDLELLSKEIEAWERARRLAVQYDVTVDPDHIQDCLDTYRDWIHKRSICPACHINGIQTAIQTYNCLNCGGIWHVSSSRFCRPYRRSMHAKKDQSDAPVLSRFI